MPTYFAKPSWCANTYIFKHEPGKSGLEKVVFPFELEFFFHFEIENHGQLLLQNRKKIPAQIEKPLFLVQIYQASMVGWLYRFSSVLGISANAIPH